MRISLFPTSYNDEMHVRAARSGLFGVGVETEQRSLWVAALQDNGGSDGTHAMIVIFVLYVNVNVLSETIKWSRMWM